MVSRTSNVKFLKTGNQCTLLDINAKLEKTKNLNTGSIVITKLEDALLLKIKKTMEGTLDLLPFNSMPKGAKWQLNEDIETAIPGTEVYDLVWTQKSLIGSIIRRKWRVYPEIETKRPKRIEWWLKLPDEEDYKLETITTISYPTEAEIQASIDKAGL